MPYLQRQVGFDPVLNYTRPATAEERAVFKNFDTHARRCTQCAYPYETYRRNKTLCERGHAYAVDVAEYIYSKAGQAYSTTDREDGNQPVQVEIPGDCDTVRELLQAVSEGLRLRSTPTTAPAVTSYDKTYYVAPRPVRRATTAAPETEVKVIYEKQPEQVLPPAPPRRRETVRVETYNRPARKERETVYYADKRDEPRRGSLYRRDLVERRDRYKGYYEEERYYR